MKDRVDVLLRKSQVKAPNPQPVDRYRLSKCLSYEPRRHYERRRLLPTTLRSIRPDFMNQAYDLVPLRLVYRLPQVNADLAADKASLPKTVREV